MLLSGLINRPTSDTGGGDVSAASLQHRMKKKRAETVSLKDNF